MKAKRFQYLSPSTAFTLIELLVVISIIALLAGLSVPVINNLKPNVVAGATRQLLDDVARARQLAIAHRTTVYMVFIPTNFWADLPTDLVTKGQAARLLDKQLVAYNFVSLHSLGDQPGKITPRYLSSWKTLPEGVYITPEKFQPRSNVPILDFYTNDINLNRVLAFHVYGFNTLTNLPFPAEDTPPRAGKNPYIRLPYIAFNYLGQLANPQYENEYIPLAKGAVLFQRDTNTEGMRVLPAVRESPPGNVTNAFNVVSIDWLTGRAHLERQQLQ